MRFFVKSLDLFFSRWSVNLLHIERLMWRQTSVCYLSVVRGCYSTCGGAHFHWGVQVSFFRCQGIVHFTLCCIFTRGVVTFCTLDRKKGWLSIFASWIIQVHSCNYSLKNVFFILYIFTGLIVNILLEMTSLERQLQTRDIFCFTKWSYYHYRCVNDDLKLCGGFC